MHGRNLNKLITWIIVLALHRPIFYLKERRSIFIQWWRQGSGQDLPATGNAQLLDKSQLCKKLWLKPSVFISREVGIQRCSSEDLQPEAAALASSLPASSVEQPHTQEVPWPLWHLHKPFLLGRRVQRSHAKGKTDLSPLMRNLFQGYPFSDKALPVPCWSAKGTTWSHRAF